MKRGGNCWYIFFKSAQHIRFAAGGKTLPACVMAFTTPDQASFQGGLRMVGPTGWAGWGGEGWCPSFVSSRKVIFFDPYFGWKFLFHPYFFDPPAPPPPPMGGDLRPPFGCVSRPNAPLRVLNRILSLTPDPSQSGWRPRTCASGPRWKSHFPSNQRVTTHNKSG